MVETSARTKMHNRKYTLVVVIPCFNEENTVGAVIRRIPKVITDIDRIKILVVDDGSTDSTFFQAHAVGAIVLRHPIRLGLGRTFRDGINRALELGADIVVNIDGDGQFDARDIPRLIGPILKNEADCVTASRFKDPQLVPKMPLPKKLGNMWMVWWLKLLTGQKFSDVSCGFRAYSREAILQMNLVGNFTYTQETFLELAFKGLRILEVPVRVEGARKFGKSSVSSNLFLYAIHTFFITIQFLLRKRKLELSLTERASNANSF